MTLAEIIRAVESVKRRQRIEDQRRANFDYTLANLIGKSVARIYNSANTMPDISEAYPTLFDSQEIEKQRQAKKTELSALRFRQFANAFNKKFNGGGKVSE